MNKIKIKAPYNKRYAMMMSNLKLTLEVNEISTEATSHNKSL